MPDIKSLRTLTDWEEEMESMNAYLVEQESPVRMRLVPLTNYAMVAVDTAKTTAFDDLSDAQKRTYLQLFYSRKPTDPLPDIEEITA